jgi:hypothetical protein
MSTSATQNRRSSYFIGILIILLGIGFIYYLVQRDARLHSGDTRHLTFSIEASGGFANITLTTPDQNLTFDGVTSTPWERNGILKSGDEVYLTAGNPSQFGSLSCSIKINGSSWKSESSNQSQDKVGCAGIIP